MTSELRLRELAVRHAAFAWLDKQRATGKETGRLYTTVAEIRRFIAGGPLAWPRRSDHDTPDGGE